MPEREWRNGAGAYNLKGMYHYFILFITDFSAVGCRDVFRGRRWILFGVGNGAAFLSGLALEEEIDVTPGQRGRPNNGSDIAAN